MFSNSYKKITKIILLFLISHFLFLISFSFANGNDNFNNDLQNSLGEISNNLQQTTPNDSSLINGEGIQSFIVYVAQDILIPLFIIVGILVAIFGFYQMFFSNTEEAMTNGSKILTRGVVGVLIMFAARYLVVTLVGTDGTTGFLTDGEFSGIELVRNIYDSIVYPLLKIALYLVIAVLFVILLTRVITFIFSSSEDAQKKSTTIIIWNTVGILIILAAKQIVEAVFGRREDILNDPLTTVAPGTDALTSGSNGFLEIIFEIINRALGLTALIVVIIILVQGYKLLVQPDSSENISSIGKSLGYAALGLFVIGAGYLIVNLLLVQ